MFYFITLFSAVLGRNLGSYDARGTLTTRPHHSEHILSEDVMGTICSCFVPQQCSRSSGGHSVLGGGGGKAGVLRCLTWTGEP